MATLNVCMSIGWHLVVTKWKKENKLILVVYGYVSFIVCHKIWWIGYEKNKYYECMLHLVMFTIIMCVYT